MDKNYRKIKKRNLIFFQNKKINDTGIFLEAMTTRQGGVSRGKYSSLNTGFNTNDNFKNVKINLERIKKALDIEELCAPVQVHGRKIIEVTRRNTAKITQTKADALITKKKNLAIGVKVADCAGIILADPVKKAAAAVHAGWRGTYKKIVIYAVNRLISKYKTEKHDIIASMSPAIGPCHYEVGKELYGKMAKESVFKTAFKIKKGKIYLDLWQANINLLLKAGLKKENIYANRLCVYDKRKLFFSFRRDGKITGRMINLVMIK